jgi:hypothetical protein
VNVVDHAYEERDKDVRRRVARGNAGTAATVRSDVQDILDLQGTAGNQAVGTLLTHQMSGILVQRQAKDAGAGDAGVAAPLGIVAVPDLVAGVKKLLVGSEEDKRKAVEWINSYNIRDIANALRLLQKDGQLPELERHAAIRPLVEVSIKAVKDANSVTDSDFAKVHEKQRQEFRHVHHIVEDSFLPKLEAVCKDLGCDPEHLLMPMTSETATASGGLAADAMNPDSHAAGLIQFMPSTLKGVGFTDGPEKFIELNATAQMDYVHKYFLPAKGNLTSAGRVYQFMFVRAGFKAGQDANSVVASSDHPNPDIKAAYDHNAKNLDTNNDGKITLGELEAIAGRRLGQARALLAALRARRAAAAKAADAGP